MFFLTLYTETLKNRHTGVLTLVFMFATTGIVFIYYAKLIFQHNKSKTKY